LEDPSPRVFAHRTRIDSAQNRLRSLLAERKVRVLGAVKTLVNAVFVGATGEQIRELALLPGVIGVERMQPARLAMNRANTLVNAQAAWQALGGAGRGGAGVKIAVIDTGIDHEHAAFQDPGLPALTGYPKCRDRALECAFTSPKIVAARSYVDRLVYYDWNADPRFSATFPDDLTARDRVGHGTAVAMVAAGAEVDTPVGRASGVAPKAYLGSYKIFGSPGVNDATFTDVFIAAMEDAFNDGMDIAVLSIRFVAEWGPADSGAICNQSAGIACDRRVAAVQAASRLGMTVVVAAGNDGDLGQVYPSLNTIGSPGTAPAAITVGATHNSHRILQTMRVTGAGVPSALQSASALFGDGPRPFASITAPARDVSKLDNDGRACEALTNGSLTGAFAIIRRGGCPWLIKAANAQRAGAAGVIFEQNEGSNFIYPLSGLQYTSIPAVLIGSDNGKALRDFVAANPGRPVTLDPTLRETENSNAADFVAYFSSYGPSTGENAIKPEIVAPGVDMLVATQKFDPNGPMFDSTGWTVVQGTSFSAPMVAGAAALVKQANPRWTPSQIKSALVATATMKNIDELDDNDKAFAARIVAVGNGKLDAGAAVKTTLTVEPAAASFGIVGARLPSGTITVTNFGSSAVNLTVQVEDRQTGSRARVVVDPATFTLQPGGTSRPVAVRLDGSTPAPGAYEGYLIIKGGPVELSVPYLYLVGNNTPFNLIPFKNYDFSGIVGSQLPGGFLFKAVDRFGVPVADVPVRFTAISGGGRIEQATRTTDDLGFAEGTKIVLGSNPGPQAFRAEAGGLPALEFIGVARIVPLIQGNGIVNASDGTIGQGLAPGSYASIYGRGLADVFSIVRTQSLPLALAGVSVSFDVPGKRESYPGRLHFVSDGQVNVQIPWELAGLNRVLVKVNVGNPFDSLGSAFSAAYDLALAPASPAPFQFREEASGRDIAILQDPAGRLITTSNPMRRGQAYVLYANGLGDVTNRPGSGEPSPAQPLAGAKGSVKVTIGGRDGEVFFAGLTPGNVGLYQVNLKVAEDTPLEAGRVNYLALVISVDGVVSKSVPVPVQP
jgi:uncharacterized protein (TIGR03437 family)